MNAVINLKPEELTEEFFMHLKLLAKGSRSIEIQLDTVDALNNLSEEEIDDRLQLLSKGKTISFTMEELGQYVHKIAG